MCLMKFYDYNTKMKMKLKNRSHRYYINRPRTRLGRKHTKHKKA